MQTWLAQYKTKNHAVTFYSFYWSVFIIYSKKCLKSKKIYQCNQSSNQLADFFPQTKIFRVENKHIYHKKKNIQNTKLKITFTPSIQIKLNESYWFFFSNVLNFWFIWQINILYINADKYDWCYIEYLSTKHLNLK